MSKQSAVIDKSLFHELCKYPDVKERERLWHELHLKYQLVVPLMLIEETVVNAVAPGKKPLDEVERLIEQVALHLKDTDVFFTLLKHYFGIAWT